MRGISDVLTVSFDDGVKDESALCVTRKCGEKIIMLKMELGEQADVLYRLLTEQMAKAEIKAESKDIGEFIDANKHKVMRDDTIKHAVIDAYIIEAVDIANYAGISVDTLFDYMSKRIKYLRQEG